jgi:hypothetical protein
MPGAANSHRFIALRCGRRFRDVEIVERRGGAIEGTRARAVVLSLELGREQSVNNSFPNISENQESVVRQTDEEPRG